MSKKTIIILAIALFALLLFILLLTQSPDPAEEMPVEEPEIIPRPSLHLATGRQAYDIKTGDLQRFKIVEAEVDPLDVRQGDSQQVRVLVKDLDDEPVTAENKVEGMVFTDNKTTPFSFELREVFDANGAILAEWEGFWILDDTYDRVYIISITAKVADREHKIELTFR